MDYQAQQQLQSDLDGTERLLWAGRPRQGLIIRKSDVIMIPFSLLWCGFAIFWEWSVATSKAPPFFLAFGGGFVLIGLYLVFGRFISDALRRRKVLYGITDSRVVIRSGNTIKSLDLGKLPDISLYQINRSEGTIFLVPNFSAGPLMDGFAWTGASLPIPQFERIGDARVVFDTLRDAQHEFQRKMQHET